MYYSQVGQDKLVSEIYHGKRYTREMEVQQDDLYVNKTVLKTLMPEPQ